jgi:hypothetical protein
MNFNHPHPPRRTTAAVLPAVGGTGAGLEHPTARPASFYSPAYVVLLDDLADAQATYDAACLRRQSRAASDAWPRLWAATNAALAHEAQQ